MWSVLVRWLEKVLGLKPLKPGYCQCDHPKCSHNNGISKCNVLIRADEDFYPCSCRIYIDENEGVDENEGEYGNEENAEDYNKSSSLPLPNHAEFENMFNPKGEDFETR